MEELLKLADNACELAMALGADQVDTYVSASHSVSVNVESNSIAACRSVDDQGISIRAFRNGAMGFAYTQRLTQDAVRELAERAVRLAGVAEPDPDFVSLPEPDTETVVVGLWDDQAVGSSAEDITGWAMLPVEEARSLEPEITISGNASVRASRHAISNSLGMRRTGRSTLISLGMSGSIREGDEVGSYYEFARARRLAEFKHEGLGAIIAREARRFLKKRPIPTGTMPVVLGPLAASGIPDAIAMLANAESVQRNRSAFSGKKGDKIASEVLTVIDEPLREGGLASGPHDGEGRARRDLLLVSEGQLVTYLHNSYTANKAKEENNARASRGGYGSSVGISCTNLNMRRGEMLAEDIIRQVELGVYMPFGSLSPNPATGDVSETIDFGLMIENGEITFPIKNSMLGGSFLELLGRIDAISKDYRSEPGMELPTVRIQDVRIAGAI